MERDEAGLLVDRDVQASDIGEADENLWIAADHIVIEFVEDPRGAVAAGAGHDGVHFGIGERGVEFGGALFVGAAQETFLAKEVFGEADFEAHLFQSFLGERHAVLVQVLGGGDDFDRVAGGEGFGEDRRRGLTAADAAMQVRNTGSPTCRCGKT